MDASDAPTLPPLLRGAAVSGDPMAEAAARARAGTDPGLILHRARPDSLSAALALAPEVTLERAAPMRLLAANALADAFGVLAPSGVGMRFDWPGGARVNDGRCGRVRAAADPVAPAAVPGWLVVGFELTLKRMDAEPGATPDDTDLWEEGCGGIDAMGLLGAWARHMLARMHDWEADGLARDAADWRGRCAQIDAPVEIRGLRGVLIGLDEHGGALIRHADGVALVPLTDMLERL